MKERYIADGNELRQGACKQASRHLLSHFRTLFVARPRRRAKSTSLIAVKKDTKKVSFFTGGEGEIRTLEPCYRLHDFQSCALDQLGDFSVLLNKYNTSFFKNQVFLIN